VRTIRKRSPPSALTQWRAPRLPANRPDGMECSYDEMRGQQDVLEAVEASLLAEQGGLCAYTGRNIEPSKSAATNPRKVDFHVEHMTAQAHCAYGQDTDYANLVACWPRPNCGFEPSYGARKKGNWPSPDELRGCEKIAAVSFLRLLIVGYLLHARYPVSDSSAGG